MNNHTTNNTISQQQWNSILETFNKHCESSNVKEDEPYMGSEIVNKNGTTKRKQFIYDNYDRFSSPGLCLMSSPDADEGLLYVYNPSEQAHAPITLEQGLEIASKFFSYEGYMMSEEIVCNYVMEQHHIRASR